MPYRLAGGKLHGKCKTVDRVQTDKAVGSFLQYLTDIALGFAVCPGPVGRVSRDLDPKVRAAAPCSLEKKLDSRSKVTRRQK